MIHKSIFTKDPANNKMKVRREFNAPLERVWQAWTNPELLDQWWAPKPWKAKTKFMDFREGGYWLYCMEGPDGMQSWGKAEFHHVKTHESFGGTDSFCDENGIRNEVLPVMNWDNHFSSTSNGTLVEIAITFASRADLEKIIEMGFEEGFTAAHQNLDALLS